MSRRACFFRSARCSRASRSFAPFPDNPYPEIVYMAAVEQKTVDSDEADMRVDRWFKTHYPDLAFGALQKLLRTGQVRVDGGRVKAETRLRSGQTVRVPPMATA